MTPPRRRTRLARFGRYAVGSGLAAATSAVVFALAYRLLDQGPRIATVAAVGSGAVVNFTANRFWAWNLRARHGLGRYALSYSAVAIVAASAGTAVTSVTHAALAGLDPNRRAVLVEASLFATYGLLFVVRFVVLDRLVFRDRRRPAPGSAPSRLPSQDSRHQVPTTTRA